MHGPSAMHCTDGLLLVFTAHSIFVLALMLSTGLLLQLLVGCACTQQSRTGAASSIHSCSKAWHCSAPPAVPSSAKSMQSWTLLDTSSLCTRTPPLQGCVLWHNWWPMLTALMYVMVPMPYLFFGAGSNDAYGSSLASGCVCCTPMPACRQQQMHTTW